MTHCTIWSVQCGVTVKRRDRVCWWVFTEAFTVCEEEDLREAIVAINIHEHRLSTSIIHFIFPFKVSGSDGMWTYLNGPFVSETWEGTIKRQMHILMAVISRLSFDIMAKLLYEASLPLEGKNLIPRNSNLLNGCKEPVETTLKVSYALLLLTPDSKTYRHWLHVSFMNGIICEFVQGEYFLEKLPVIVKQFPGTIHLGATCESLTSEKKPSFYLFSFRLLAQIHQAGHSVKVDYWELLFSHKAGNSRGKRLSTHGSDCVEFTLCVVWNTNACFSCSFLLFQIYLFIYLCRFLFHKWAKWNV